MLTRLNALAAAAALCASSVGCRTMECGDGCGRGCSLAFEKYDCSCEVCGGGATTCNPTSCTTPCGVGSCDEAGCTANCCRSGSEGGDGRGLKGWLSRLCGCTGCGEMYWSEWYADPPAVCEPCDRCGNYAGAYDGQCGGYRATYRGEAALAGQRHSTTTREALELAERRHAAAKFPE